MIALDFAFYVKLFHIKSNCVESIRHQELICDEIGEGDNREFRTLFIHAHRSVWYSPDPAHAHCGRCHVYYQICTKEIYQEHSRRKGLLSPSAHWLTSHLGQAPKVTSFLRGNPRGIQTGQLWQTVHGEARIRRRKGERVTLQNQCSEKREGAQGVQQGLLVLKLTVTEVQTHQLGPEVIQVLQGMMQHMFKSYSGKSKVTM